MKKAAIITASITFAFSVFMASFASAEEYKSKTSEAADLSLSEALELVGAPVISNTGQLVGANEEIVFDQTGEPSYLLLSRPEQTGVIPIPIEKVQVVEGTMNRNWLSVGYDEEKIANAPTFGSVDAFTMPGTRVKVRSYFGME